MNNSIRGRTRTLDKVNVPIKAKIHNRFDIEVIDSRTGKVRQRAQAENVICNQLWTMLSYGNYNSRYFLYIHYGTGTGTPSAADTSLFTFTAAASATNMTTKMDAANNLFSCTKKIRLSETTAIGITLTEVGIGSSDSSSSLCTHAMLKDMNGNQISISKTSTDIINIYATVFVHWSSTLNTGNIRLLDNASILFYLTGNSSSGYYQYYCPSYYSTSKGARLFDSKGIFNKSVSNSINAAAKTITLSIARIAANVGNMPGGIGCINLYNYDNSSNYYPCFAIKTGSDWFAGSTITGEAVGTGDGSTKDFATDFDFPQNAKIYVDGVEASGVTVDNAPITNADMAAYFDEVTVIDGVAYPKETNNLSNNTNSGFTMLGAGTYYNPHYTTGIKSFAKSSPDKVEVSNDLITWVTLTLSATTTVPVEYRNYKYWRVSAGAYYGIYNLISDTFNTTNIHFATAPVSGAVITADYTTPVIAKDTNHVFDLTITITYGEYTT